MEQPPDSHQGRFRASQLTKTEAAQPAEPFLSQIETKQGPLLALAGNLGLIIKLVNTLFTVTNSFFQITNVLLREAII